MKIIVELTAAYYIIAVGCQVATAPLEFCDIFPQMKRTWFIMQSRC